MVFALCVHCLLIRMTLRMFCGLGLLHTMLCFEQRRAVQPIICASVCLGHLENSNRSLFCVCYLVDNRKNIVLVRWWESWFSFNFPNKLMLRMLCGLGSLHTTLCFEQSKTVEPIICASVSWPPLENNYRLLSCVYCLVVNRENIALARWWPSRFLFIFSQ